MIKMAICKEIEIDFDNLGDFIEELDDYALLSELEDRLLENNLDTTLKCFKRIKGLILNTLEDDIYAMERDEFEKLFEIMKNSWQNHS